MDCHKDFKKSSLKERKKPVHTKNEGIIYICPMHPEIKKPTPDDCPICGMTLEPESFENTEHSGSDNLISRFWLSFGLSFPLLILNMATHFTSGTWLKQIPTIYIHYFEFVLSTPVVLWCGWPFFQLGYLSIQNRALNMFTLIALGIGVSYGYSVYNIGMSSAGQRLDVYFEPAAVITTLVLLGQILEHKARAKTNQVIRQLLMLAPEKANLLHPDGTEEEISVSHIRINDKIRIRPGDKVPVDGIIREGYGVLDQSMLTGEAIPVEKKPGDSVLAGVINQNGSFILTTELTGKNTFLSQIAEVVTKAQRSRAPIQQLADIVSAYFVPTVIIISLLTAGLWLMLGPEPKMHYALLTSVAVLIIACPCALGLATPMSIMMGLGLAARQGILIRNAEALEKLAKTDIVVVDKTGTLTEGKLTITDIINIHEQFSPAEILKFAASIEQNSEHPWASAIHRQAEKESSDLKPCTEFTSFAGQGVTGIVENRKVSLGNMNFIQFLNLANVDLNAKIAPFLKPGNSIIFVAIGDDIAGFMVAADRIKSTTKIALDTLRANGIKIVMLTGDHHLSAQSISMELGIENFSAEILPIQKSEFISRLQAQGYKVAMIGDGINDAPALAQADVGIAMGTGTHIAIESADVTLLSADLNDITKAWRLSHLTMINIRENLLLAFIYNTLSIPIAAGVFYPLFGWLLNPMLASVVMSLSSISVIINSMRLSKIKLP